MARQAQPGEPAKFNYQEVKYSPFGAPPGESLVLTADPWSYLYAWLEKQRKKRKGTNRQALSRASYYAELAEGFSKASDLTTLPTKGTLAYYALLNLAKCFISVRGVTLERVQEHHGVSLDGSRKVKINPNAAARNVNIFHEFARQLGSPVVGTHSLSLEEMCCHIPELHEMAFSLDSLPNNRRKFLPVRIQLLVNATQTALFTEMSYDKSHEAQVPYQKFYRGVRGQYFNELGEKDGRLVFRSKGRKPLKKTKKNCTQATLFKKRTPKKRSGALEPVVMDEEHRFKLKMNEGVFEVFRDGNKKESLEYEREDFESGRIGFIWNGGVAGFITYLEIEGRLDSKRMAKEIRRRLRK